MSDIPDDICANCGQDCTYFESLIWYHINDILILSFCGDECFEEWKEKEQEKNDQEEEEKD